MFCEFDHKIFDLDRKGFTALALDLARFQYRHNSVYRQYADMIHTVPAGASLVPQLPFLPISFFKSKRVVAGEFTEQLWFESSGTTGSEVSRHYVKDVKLYRESFTCCFRQFYGDPASYCIIALLPSYLERRHSSLVYMVNELMALSGHPENASYLYDWPALHQKLQHLGQAGQPTLLIGVTFALLDFAAQAPLPLRNTLVMETGGMKGRQAELTRPEVHARLMEAFGISAVHSEYGMTELLSQAYSQGGGRFYCPPWMEVLIRDEDDPFAIRAADDLLPGETAEGLINVADLANVYSCSFLATDDVGRLHADGSFEVLGRKDNSDIRGCSLMVAAGSG